VVAVAVVAATAAAVVVAAAAVTVVIAAAAVAMAAAVVAAIANPVGKHFLTPQMTPGALADSGHQWLLFVNAPLVDVVGPFLFSRANALGLELTNAFGVITSAQGLRTKETSRSL
jgi:hypothetical protein